MNLETIHSGDYLLLASIYASVGRLEDASRLYGNVTLRQGEKKHYNQKVDAYSFAIVLWELLHNRLPFEGMSNLQAAYVAAFKLWVIMLYDIDVVILMCSGSLFTILNKFFVKRYDKISVQ
uniref:Uncharacterized protein n=1 Tax=Lactuca sativa TaxID=4236 RepID=A0A9R1W160_LACSA|nr:hypothetical protein LSAT_V11C300120480 [Lactuca sativa]